MGLFGVDSCKKQETNPKLVVGAKTFQPYLYESYVPEELVIQRALVEHGPLAVGFKVDNELKSVILTDGQVFRGSTCNSVDERNHIFAIVGYGVDLNTTEKYWTVKNSWGADFGWKGYFRVVRGENMCGIEESWAYPVTPKLQGRDCL